MGGEGVGFEFFLGEVGAVEVAGGEAWAGDAEFAGRAGREELAGVIEDVEFVVGDALLPMVTGLLGRQSA